MSGGSDVTISSWGCTLASYTDSTVTKAWNATVISAPMTFKVTVPGTYVATYSINSTSADIEYSGNISLNDTTSGTYVFIELEDNPPAGEPAGETLTYKIKIA